MKLSPSKLYSIHKVLAENGLNEYRGNIYTDGINLYYPHNITDFYEMQIKQFGHILNESEYQRHLEYEKLLMSYAKSFFNSD